LNGKNQDPPIHFLFPGHGSERPQMTHGLYISNEIYRQDLDHCLAIAQEFLKLDIRSYLFPVNVPEDLARRQLSQTIVAQPILFSIEYSLALLLERLGVKPSGMLGHSVSEYVAACLAGVFPLETAMEIVCKRGQLVQSMPEGAMLAVSLSEKQATAYLNEKVALGSTISDHQCVISGYPDAVFSIQSRLAETGIDAKPVKVTRAFHSMMLDPVLNEFRSFVADKKLSSPNQPFISGVDGCWIDSESAQSPDYWATQLRQPVRLHEGITTISNIPNAIFLEVGKGTMLSSIVRAHPKIKPSSICLNTIPASHNSEDDLSFLIGTLNTLSSVGISNKTIISGMLGNKNARHAAEKSTSPSNERRVSPLEKWIARTFCEVLGLEAIDRHQNFLEVGGNSLMAMQLLSRLRKKVDHTITLNTIFENLTIAELAATLSEESVRPTTTAPGGTPSQIIDSTLERSKRKHHPQERPSNGMQFSLFFFSGEEGLTPEDPYQLVMNGAKFADENNFDAVWLPERHFNAFGGLYPNPALLGAAIAVTTKQIHIRSGSVVAPLHHPIRITEDWSVLDNLSKGRIGISFGSGFHPRDFLLAPDHFKNRRSIMLESIQTINDLWCGTSFAGPSGLEENTAVSVFPTPYSNHLPMWLTTSRSVDTFIEAGRLGANILTALLRLSIPELQENIRAYRRALQEAGFPPDHGIVTLMLHTFVGTDKESIRAQVEKPMKDYLRSHMEHTKTVASEKNANENLDLSPNEKDELLNHSLNRYLEENSLIGTETECLKRIKILKDVGVNEVACLVDFGVEESALMESLKHLNSVRIESQRLFK
jgi:natural product biosynthesis luciferase-like monooxygenase protein